MKYKLLFTTAVFILAQSIGSSVARADDTKYDALNNLRFFSTEENTSNCQTSTSAAISTNAPAANLTDFVKKYAQFAIETGKKYGIPYEAILAQATLESGMGKSSLTTKYNNFFGIKKGGKEWTGPVVNLNTQEDTGGGSMVTQSATFRVYATPQEGFNGYGQFITENSRYKPALAFPGDPYKYVAAIKEAGYATDSSYVSKLSSLIDKIKKTISDNGISEPSSTLTPTPAITTSSDSSTTGDSSTNCTDGSGNGSDIVPSGTNNEKIVQVAKAELAKNVHEYDSNVLKYTDDNQEAWCADFVSWVYKQAGTPFNGGASGGWRQASVLNLQAWFKKNGTYFDVGSGTPQPGDVAFYIGSQTPDGGSSQHVNLVVAASGDTMTTIGGNQSNRVTIGTRKIALGVDSLVGFGRMK